MRAELAVAAAFLLAVCLTRWPAFWRSVLDWDESLYFLIAAQWRAGHLPYTTIWDNKPVGIYAIFAVFQALFGERVAAIRIATIVFVTVASCAVRGITARLTGDRGCALAAGTAYIIGSLSNDGLAANTETFMATFTALAVLAACAAPGWRPAALAGLLMGAAFMTKYVAIFEDPAILFLILSRSRRREMAWVTFIVLAAAALPLAATALKYWHDGQLPWWWDASIASNFRRAAKTISPGTLAYAADIEIWRWGSLFFCAMLVLAAAVPVAFRIRRARRPDQFELLFLALWLIGGCAGVAAAKSFFDHYFLQILPALCVMFGWLLHRARRYLTKGRWFVVLLACLALPGLAAATALRDAMAPVLTISGGAIRLQPDIPARIAADLAPQLTGLPGGGVYVFDDQPIIYALLHRPPPTKFVLPSVLTTNFLASVAGIDPGAEVRRILATNPLFIIRRTRPPDISAINPAIYATLAATLAAHYQLWRAYPGSEVYRLVR